VGGGGGGGLVIRFIGVVLLKLLLWGGGVGWGGWGWGEGVLLWVGEVFGCCVWGFMLGGLLLAMVGFCGVCLFGWVERGSVCGLWECWCVGVVGCGGGGGCFWGVVVLLIPVREKSFLRAAFGASDDWTRRVNCSKSRSALFPPKLKRNLPSGVRELTDLPLVFGVG